MHDSTRYSYNASAALRTVFELMSQGVFVVDRPTDRIVDVNVAACDVLGRTRKSVIGRSWTGTAGRLGELTLYNVDPPGRQFVAVVGTPANEIGRRSATAQDSLTGLANREALRTRVSGANDGTVVGRLALLFIDLNGFKQINDNWGHATGDAVLRVVAQRLSASVRPCDLVVRFGGDEFLVVVEQLSRRRDLERLARRVARAVEKPILVDGHQIVLTASIGIAQQKSRTGTIEALIAEADRAMYRAKSQSRASECSARVESAQATIHKLAFLPSPTRHGEAVKRNKR